MTSLSVKTFFSTDEKLKEYKDGEITYTVEDGTLSKTGATEATHNTKVESDFTWGIEEETTLNDKADKLVEVVTDLLKPLDGVLSLLLAGGVYEFDGTTYGDSLGAFKEINIMGGSGYNYAIIPLLEALSVPAAEIKTQAEYEATIKTQGTLGYILETILHTVNENLSTPLDFVLGLFANLAYTISKDGVTTFVGNLIAPLSEVIEAIEGVLPLAIKVDLMQLMDGGSIAEILLGDDVALKGAKVGLTLDLDCDTLEELLAKVLAKFVAGFDITIDFSDIAAKSAKLDTNGAIIYTDSKVDPKWDICNGVPGKNIQGDPTATIITLLALVVTEANIDSLLQMLKVDFSTLPAGLGDLLDKALASPDVLIGAVIKLLASNYNIEQFISAMVFYFLGEAEYDYSNIEGGLLNNGQGAVNSAIAKFDKMINNLIPSLLKLLGNDLEKPVELIKDIYVALGEDADKADLKALVDYLLNDLVFNNDMMNMLLGLIVGLLGGIDAKTFTTVVDIVKEILSIDLSPAGIAAVSAANGGKVAAFINAHTASDANAGLTWADIANAHKHYEYKYMVEAAKDAVGEEGDEDYEPAVEAKYETVVLESAELAGTEYTPEGSEKAYTLEASTDKDGKHVTKVVLTENWNVSDKDSFLNILYEVTAVVEPLLAFLFKGEDINIFIDTLSLKGNNGYTNALIPLAKALHIDIEEDTSKFNDANDMLKAVIDGVFGLVEDIEKAPLSTILEVLGSASYFIANNGIEIVIENLISPVIGLLSIFEKKTTVVENGETVEKSEGITMADINALLKNLINMDLNDITGIAGPDGSKLVTMLNEVLAKAVLVGDGETITVTNYLPAKFFEIMSTYAINYDSMTAAQREDASNYRTFEVLHWSVDKADVLMYLLSTVCTEEFLGFIGTLAKAEEGTVLGDLIYGLAGDQDKVINIISMLLNEYKLVYNKYDQTEITKENVDPKAPLTDENLAQALQAIDGLVPAIIGLLVKDADSLKGLIENLVAGADLGNLLMNLLVPLLGGLDIDAILGYVKEFSNLNIKLDPSAWAGTSIEAFINKASDLDGNGKISWAEVEAYYTQYEYTYTIPGVGAEGDENYVAAKTETVYKPLAEKNDYEVTIGEGENAKKYILTPVYSYEYTYKDSEGKEQKYYSDTAGLTEADIDGNEETAAVAVTFSKAVQKSKMVSEHDWNIDTFDGLKNFAVDLLKPLDVVFELLLAGGNIIIAPDKKADVEPYPAEITVRGSDGYNFAIIPLLEAFGANGLKSQAEYEAQAAADGSHLKYVLDVLFAEVEEILETPVSQLMSRLANLFYFIGNNAINDLAKNLLAPVNTLIAEVDEIFPLAISIDVSKVGIEGASIIETYLGKAHAGVPAGITLNVEANALATLLNDLLGGIEIGGTKLGLSLDLDWLKIAAKMAKTEDPAKQSVTGSKIAIIESAMDYDAYANVEGTTEYADGEYYNIEGHVVDTFITLLQVLLTQDNTEALKTLLEGLLKDAPQEVKDILNDILSDPDAFEKLIGVVVLLLTGEGEMTGYPLSFAYKFLGELNYNYKDAEINSAISKFDAMLAREAVGVIKLIGTPAEDKDPADYNFIEKLATGVADDATLSDVVAWLLSEFAFTEKNFDTVMSLLNNILADAITADLAGILGDLLPIDLMPVAFAAKTENAKLIAYVQKAVDEAIAKLGENATDAQIEAATDAVTWADVREANADKVDDEWVYAESWKISGKDAFIGAFIDLLKPLNPILDFLFAGKKLSFKIDGVELWGANGYANAIVPLLNALGAKQLGVNLPADATSTTEALGYIVDALLGADGAKGVVNAICEAPLTSILKIVGNLSFFLANGNLDELIQNLIAPVFGILELAESLLSREDLDTLIEGLAKITLPGGKALNITNIINIAGDEGEGLVAIINELVGGIRAYEKEIVVEDGKNVSKIVVYDKAYAEAHPEFNWWPVDKTDADGEVVYEKDENGDVVLDKDGKPVAEKVYYKVLQVINLLPDDFFKTFAKYVIEDNEYENVPVTTIGKAVDSWSINAGDALMYVLSTVLDYDFFETILKKVGLDLSQGIGATVLTMADKENELVDVLVMLLNDYKVVYTKVEQDVLPSGTTAAAPYENFGEDANGEALLDNNNTSNAIAALDPLINTIIAMVADGKTLGGLINGLIADADLANLIMNMLVPVLAGLDIDAILGYVNELTNIKLTTLNPALWTENEAVKFGSELKNFLNAVPKKTDDKGNELALTWADVAEYYTRYEFTYTIPGTDAVGTEGEEGYKPATEPQTITVFEPEDATEITVGEGENVKKYALTPVYTYEYIYKDAEGKEQKYYSTKSDLTTADVDGNKDTEEVAVTRAVDEDGKLVEGKHNSKMYSQYDWKIEDLNDLIPLVCDLLQPLDIVFQILLSGKPIIALEDESSDRADIRIMGGVGYNYAIIPLLEAFGATGLKTQAEYDAQVAADGSSLKYILETLIGEVEEILSNPLNELLSRLANLFYFIGSDGINAIADNLLAPLNTLINEVDDLFPLAIRIDVAADEIIGLYLGKEHDGVPAGITVNVAGADLAELINGLIGNLKIGEVELKLHLDLDWTAIAAKMAKKDDAGKIVTTGTKQVYNIGTVKNPATPDLVNLAGDPANALVTLLDTVLTEDNCENIYNLVTGLLKDLDPTLKGVIEELIGSPESIKGIVAAVVLIFTGEYDVDALPYVFKTIGTLAVTRGDDAEGAVTSLDRVLVAGAPVIIELLGAPKADVKEEDYTFINKMAVALQKKTNATLSDVVDYLLNDLLFTDDMMATITGALLGLLKGLGADLLKTLNDILGIDLAPKAFAEATGNAQLIAYVGDADTWAKVAENNIKEIVPVLDENDEPVLNEDGSPKTETVYEPIFKNVSGKDAWVGAILDMLKPLEGILAFLLTGKNLVISIENEGEKAEVTLKGGKAYSTALVPLVFQGLGLEELNNGENKSVIVGQDASTANEAIKKVLDFIIDDEIGLVSHIEKAPLTTILTVVANLSYFIANDDVAVAIQNLAAPILGIVDALGGVISREQLDSLLGGLLKVTLPGGKPLNLTNIINIAGNNGAILVDLLNGILGGINIYEEGKTYTKAQAEADKNSTYVEVEEGVYKKVVQVVNALPETFFLDIAKASVTVLEANGTDVKRWQTHGGNAIMYVLSTVLTTDFLNILCDLIGLEKTNVSEDGTESPNMIYDILTSLAGKSDELIDLLLKLLNKYLVEYKTYVQPDVEKIDVTYASGEQAHQQLNETLKGLDSLIPVIMNLIGGDKEDAPADLAGLVYPLFVKDDIANLLVSAIVKLLAGLPVDTLNMIQDLVGDLSNLKNDGDSFSIAPQAFAKTKFGSKLGAYIGTAETWADVWEAHSEEQKDEDGNVVLGEDGKPVIVASAYAWGINEVDDFINLICDMLLPLDCILELILMGGMVRAEFDEDDAYNSFTGKSLSILDGVNVCGGNGYNYAIIPLLEIFGVQDIYNQAQYEAYVTGHHGSTLHYVLTALFGRVDEILKAPIKSVLEILANLSYVLANGNLGTIVENLIAPVNDLIKAVDPIFPIAIKINIGNIGAGEGYPIVETYLGKAHKGVEAGLTLQVDGGDLSTLINNLVSGIAINDAPLGISVDLNWDTIARTAAADADNNGKGDFAGSKMSTVFDIYNGGSYKNLKGDLGDTFYVLLKTILTQENWEALKKALNLDLGTFEGLIEDIIKDPTSILDLIVGLLGNGTVSYIPVQNRPINLEKFDYRSYGFLTEANADIIAANIDALINDILKLAGVGNNLKDLIMGIKIGGKHNLVSNGTVNMLLDLIVGLLAGESVEPILDAIAGLDIAVVKDGEKTGEVIHLDLTVEGFYKEINRLAATRGYLQGAAAMLRNKTSWAQVESFQDKNVNWNITTGNLEQFVQALAGILTPLNPVLKLLLMGEGSGLRILDIITIGGGNGYDYGIIPLLEAFGLTAGEVKTQAQYEAFVAQDETQVLGYVLNRIAVWADRLLSKPVDKLLEILPNVAYFLSNEGLFLTVRNVAAPVFGLINVISGIIPGFEDLLSGLELGKILHGIDVGGLLGEILGAKYDFRIPEIDFYKLAKVGTAKKEVGTSRSLAANSFNTPTNPHPYIENYPNGYENWQNKTSQTYIVSDKGDTLTLVFTWIFEMFGDAHNREALVQWLVQVFDLKAGSEQTVRYAIDQLFKTGATYGIPDIIVTALFHALGIAVVVDQVFQKDFQSIQEIFKKLFADIANGSTCVYGSIARVMEQMTGIWYETVGDDEDHKEAEDEAEETLNWFQRLIKKIKEFFAKIFGIFG